MLQTWELVAVGHSLALSGMWDFAEVTKPFCAFLLSIQKRGRAITQL